MRRPPETKKPREVALPLFKVDLELLVLERKELPPPQEYVLRALELGLTQLEDIAGLLGVEEPVVRSAAADLLGADCLVLTTDEHDRRHRLLGQALTADRLAAARPASLAAVEHLAAGSWEPRPSRRTAGTAHGRRAKCPNGHLDDRRGLRPLYGRADPVRCVRS